MEIARMRRHLIGLGLGVVMLIVMFFGGAWGYLRLLRLPAAAGASAAALPAQGGSLLSSGGVITAIAAVAATGLVAGVLIAWPRISPVATGLPALVALAWTGLYLDSVKRAVDLIPLRGRAFGAGWEALLFNGILGLAGLALMIPACLPGRWRDPRAAEDEAIAAEVSDAREYVADLRATLGPDPAVSPRRSTAGLAGARPGTAAQQQGAVAQRQGAVAQEQGATTRDGAVITGLTIPPSARRVTGAQPAAPAAQQRVTGPQQWQTGAQRRLTGGYRWPSQAQQRPSDPRARVTGAQQTLGSGEPKMTGAELRARLRQSGSQPRLPEEP
jgi:hypothetical protein